MRGGPFDRFQEIRGNFKGHRLDADVFRGQSRSRSQAKIGAEGKVSLITSQKKYLLDSTGQTEYLALLRKRRSGSVAVQLGVTPWTIYKERKMEDGTECSRNSVAKWLQRSQLLRGGLALFALVILGGMLTPCFADQGPAPDPSGTATGDRTTTTDAGGTPFVVPAPSDPSAPDYAQKKKDYDEYQAQVAKEPLAAKLADNLGHVRIATNFSWTLNTGYLVLFMQAGFALLTCGLVRKKNAAPSDDAEFCGVCFRLPRLLRGRIRLPVRRRRRKCGALQSRRHSHAQSLPARQRPMGISGRQRLFLSGPAYDAGSNCLALFEIVFMETAGYIIVGAICERITFWGFLICELFVGAILYPDFRLLGVGRRMAVSGWLHHESWATAMSTSLVRLWFTRLEASAPWRWPIVLGPRLGKYGPDGKMRVFPAHNLVFCGDRDLYSAVWMDGL